METRTKVAIKVGIMTKKRFGVKIQEKARKMGVKDLIVLIKAQKQEKYKRLIKNQYFV